MKQITRSIYIVQTGEDVTVEIVATKVGEFASLVIDGSPQQAVSSGPIKYQFTVTKPVGDIHFGMITGFFPPTTPDDANYQVFVSGSMGGGKFTGSDIAKTNSSHHRGLEIRVE